MKNLFTTFNLFLYFTFCSFSHPDVTIKTTIQPTDKFEISVCMIFHDEAPWLEEWIEYHSIVGVQHFYLYNNRSTDHFEEVLEDYILKGIVTLLDWPFGDAKNYIPYAQIPAYCHALIEFGPQTRWMAIIDSDEFIVPVSENTIMDVLKDYDDYGGLVVNWQTFGTSNVAKIKTDELMIEKLTWMTISDNQINAYFKSIVRTDRVDASNCDMNNSNCHGFPYLPGYFAVNTLGISPKSNLWTDVCIDRIQINHYRTRDEEYFNNYKIPRLQQWCRLSKAVIENLTTECHQVESDTILRFVPVLKERMGLE